MTAGTSFASRPVDGVLPATSTETGTGALARAVAGSHHTAVTR